MDLIRCTALGGRPWENTGLFDLRPPFGTNLSIMREFRLFVLQKLLPQPHAYVGDFPVCVRDSNAPTGITKLLREVVHRYIGSLQEFKSWGESSINSIEFVVRNVG